MEKRSQWKRWMGIFWMLLKIGWGFQILHNGLLEDPNIDGSWKLSTSTAFDPVDDMVYFTHWRGVSRWKLNPTEPGGLSAYYSTDLIEAVGIGIYQPLRKIFVCYANRKVYSYNMDGVGDLSSTGVFHYTPNCGLPSCDIAFKFCVFDFERMSLYIGKSGVRNTIERIDIEPDRVNWNGNFIQSESELFDSNPLTGILTSTSIFVSFMDERIVEIDRNNPDLRTAIIRNERLGFGTYNGLAVDEARGYLLLGNQVGVGFKIRLQDFSFINFLFLSDSSISTIVVDQDTGASFWGVQTTNSVTLGGKVIKVNNEDFKITGQVSNTLSGYTDFKALALTKNWISAGLRRASTGVGGTKPYVSTIQITNCVGNTCQQCIQSDPNYCGWCPNSQGFSCSTKNSCTGSFGNFTWSNNFDSCPIISSIQPPSGSTSGGTVVSLTTSNSIFINDSQTKCIFEDQSLRNEITPSLIEPMQLICVTPSRSPGTVNVTIEYNNSPYTSNKLTFDFYSCTQPTCGQCLSQLPEKQECGWCAASGTCTSQHSACLSGFWNQNVCPSLLSVIPESYPISGGPVEITGTYFAPGSNYQCVFGSNVQPAIRISNTTISCTAPSVSVENKGVVEISVRYDGTNYAENTLSFLYYDCGSENRCGSCIDPLKGCSWCFSEGVCQSSSSSCSGLGNPLTSCAILASAIPSSARVDTPFQPVLVKVFGGPFPQSESYQCKFGNSYSPATWINSTLVQCQTPELPKGVVDLNIYHLTQQFNEDPGLQFEYYDCDRPTCGECLNPSIQAGCNWCVFDNACGSEGTCTLGSTIQSCPEMIVAVPDSGGIGGNTEVTITVSNVIDDNYFECVFGTQSVPALRLGPTTLVCTSPSSTNGTVALSITYKGVVYTFNQLTFTYYDCDAQLSCNTCTEFSECRWCLDSNQCTYADQCNVNSSISFCPVLESVSPPYCRPEGGTLISVQGSIFLPTGSYKCVFGSIVVSATFISSNQIICTCPPRSIGNITISVQRDNTLYFPNNLPFTYFECTEAGNCSMCAPYPICGWCWESNQCVEIERCSSSAFWTGQCPQIQQITPDHSSTQGGISLNITGNSFLAALNLECEFKQPDLSTYTPAQIFSESNIGCNSPLLSIPSNLTEQIIDFRIVHAINSSKREERTVYTQNPFNFKVLDCSSYQDCNSCINGPVDCGWCLSSAVCSTLADCTSDPSFWNTDECPIITSVDPPVGPSNGGTKISIEGKLFVPGLEVRFDDKGVPATFLSSTMITAITPSKSGGTVTIRLFLNNNQYTESSIKWTFIDDSQMRLIAILSGMAGLLVVGLIAGIILMLVIRRKKKTADSFLESLEEPQYEVFAFSQDKTEVYSINRRAAAGMAALEKFLLERVNLPFVHLLCSLTNAIESDKLSQSLIYVFESNNRSIELLSSFVSREMREAESETTLFRAQSYACKMFKVYSKMVGIPYLWKTLGHFINEIAYADASVVMSNRDRLIPQNIEIEIDPTRLDDPSDEDINKLQLLLVTSKIFKALIKSIDDFPMGIRVICHDIFNQVKEKYPELEFKYLGSFIFLRFICPAITAPHSYGLLKEPPSDKVQRQLILVSKILQNLANGIQFGKKEEFMKKMNEFIETNIEKLQEFLEQLVSIDPTILPAEASVPKNVKTNSLGFLHHHIVNRTDKLDLELDKISDIQGISALKLRFQELLNEMGPPPGKTKSFAN